VSLAFTIPGADALTPDELRRWLRDGVVLRDRPDDDAFSQEVGWLEWPGRSIRGVPVLWTAEDGMVVRVLTLASADDIAVAVGVAADLATRRGRPLDDGTGLTPPARLAARWDGDRRRRHARAEAREMLRRMAVDPVRIAGVRRPVRLGPRLRARLGEDPQALLGWMLWAQWPDGDPPIALPAEPLDAGTDGVRVASWDGSRPALLPAVELVRLVGPRPVLLPRADLLDLLGERAVRFDEDRMLLPALPPRDRNTLQARAAGRAVTDPVRWRPPVPTREGQLLPVLRPPGWARRGTALCWSVAPRGEGLPLVSLVWDGPRESVHVDTDDPMAEHLDQALERAVSALGTHLPAWEVRRDADGRPRSLSMTGPWASEVLLSPRHLRDAQARLGARALLVAIPARGQVRIQQASPEQEASIGALVAWADRSFREAAAHGTGQPLTPQLLVVVDGQVQGPVRSPVSTEVSVDDLTLDSVALGLRTPSPASTDLVAGPGDPAAPEPWQVALLSGFLPGLGQWWLGLRRVAAGFFGVEISLVLVLALATAVAGLGDAVLLLALAPLVFLAIHAYAAWDAWARASRHPSVS
jgi:hypothetical protein